MPPDEHGRGSISVAPQVTEQSRHLSRVHLLIPPPPGKQEINIYCVEPLFLFFNHQNYPNGHEIKDANELAQENEWHLCVYMSTSQLDEWQDL